MNNFTNITQEQFYKLYEILEKTAAQNGFGEIAKFSYDYSDWTSKKTVVKHDRGFNATHVFAVVAAVEYWVNGIGQSTFSEIPDKWISLSTQ